MRLFGEPGWGSAIVEAQLNWYGLAYDFERVGDLFTSAEGRQRLSAVNPLAQIPTLVLSDGTVLTESAAITLHASPADAWACCRAAKPSSSKTKTVRSSSPTLSAPDSITPLSDPSTHSTATAAASSLPTPATTKCWKRFNSAHASKASSPRSKARTLSPTA